MSPEDSPFTLPNFEEVTTQKLAHYMIVAQKSMYRLHPRFFADQAAINERWQAIQNGWEANPENPYDFPDEGRLTIRALDEYYAKCDAICDLEPTTDDMDVDALIRMCFAANNGVQYIISILSDGLHPSRYKIQKEAADITSRYFDTPEQIGSTEESRPADSPSENTKRAR